MKVTGCLSAGVCTSVSGRPAVQVAVGDSHNPRASGVFVQYKERNTTTTKCTDKVH